MSKSSETAAAWMYRGVWRLLARWFAVPEQPPDLPARAGETIERFRPSANFVRYLKFWFWLGLTAIDGVFLAGWIASFFVSLWLGVALAPVFVMVAILPDLVAFVGIHLRYDTTWYLLSNRSLRIRRGIWTIHEATITFENVQDVKIQQGPVQRHFGIADVIVQTAGGGAKSPQKGAGAATTHTGLIEGVGDAERIRDLIMARVRQSRTAGLGDEDVKQLASSRAPGLSWTIEHVDALRAIRDELAKLRASG
jgi:membrane protein YdbS with pleckstrin-like domain